MPDLWDAAVVRRARLCSCVNHLRSPGGTSTAVRTRKKAGWSQPSAVALPLTATCEVDEVRGHTAQGVSKRGHLVTGLELPHKTIPRIAVSGTHGTIPRSANKYGHDVTHRRRSGVSPKARIRPERGTEHEQIPTRPCRARLILTCVAA